MMTKEELIAFEEEIAQLFNEGKIRSPIHLDKGCEDELIKVFTQVKPNDWVFSTHRSHYICLLKGVSPNLLMCEILANHSINLNFREYRVFTSAIVAGVCPIAVGVALALKRQKSEDKVWCVVGDMAARTGIFYESVRYSEGFALPITFVVADNGMSVNTPTVESWGTEKRHDKIMFFEYERGYPHSGTGKWLKFYITKPK